MCTEKTPHLKFVIMFEYLLSCTPCAFVPSELPEEPVVSVGPSHSPVQSSTPHNPSPSRDASPMHKMVKRSSSMEDSPGCESIAHLNFFLFSHSAEFWLIYLITQQAIQWGSSMSSKEKSPRRWRKSWTRSRARRSKRHWRRKEKL